MRLALGVILVVASGGCHRSGSLSSGPLSRWRVDSIPRILISSNRAPAGEEFTTILGARRLASGDILIANSGAHRLMVFDSTGAFLRSFGRKGQGPGDFGEALYVFGGPADSVAVFDAGNIRWNVVSPSGAIARVLASNDSSLGRPSRLYQGALITSARINDVAGWILRRIAALRAQDSAARHVIIARVADDGSLWVRDSIRPSTWRVYESSNDTGAEVDLPAGLEPVQLGWSSVLGVIRDSSDVEEVRVYRFDRPGVERTERPALASPPVDDKPRAEDGPPAGLFRKVLMAQERFYGSHSRYSPSVDSLALPGAEVRRAIMLNGDRQGWAMVYIAPSGRTCGVGVGFNRPAGWLDGTPLCGR